MTTIFICPTERPGVSALEKSAPLVCLSVLGKPFIYHWLEHLAESGAKSVTILAPDRPEQLRHQVGDGSRWGLAIEVIPEAHELSIDEVQKKYFKSADRRDVSENSIFLIDHLPGFPAEKLFASYTAFFSAMHQWMAATPSRNPMGFREIRPGIWAGLRSQISPTARLTAPCWIGENVLVEAESEIGPMSILESNVVVQRGASVINAWVGGETFVGNFTQVKNSLAAGDTLVNLLNSSVVTIPDSFLLCALQDRDISLSVGNLFGRCVALLVLMGTLPFALITILKSKCLGHRAFRSRRAAAPQGYPSAQPSTILYYELSTANGWWKRWPQLWSVVRGEFAWVGNRPLTTFQASQLENDFERLWLAAPIGLVSKGDSEGCSGLLSDEAKAHASFYSTQANWRADIRILFRALNYLLGRKKPVSPTMNSAALKSSDLMVAR